MQTAMVSNKMKKRNTSRICWSLFLFLVVLLWHFEEFPASKVLMSNFTSIYTLNVGIFDIVDISVLMNVYLFLILSFTRSRFRKGIFFNEIFFFIAIILMINGLLFLCGKKIDLHYLLAEIRPILYLLVMYLTLRSK